MTFDPTLFSHTETLPHPVSVTLPDGSIKPVTITGDIHLSSHLTLHNVLFVPDFRYNLLSVAKFLADNQCCTTFYPSYCVFQDLSTKLSVAVGKQASGLYTVDPSSRDTASSHTVAVSKDFSPINSSANVPSNNSVACHSESLDVLHARLGQTSFSKMQHIPSCKPLLSKSFSCDTCVMAKLHELPFNKSYISTTHPFQLAHMDLWGPYRIISVTGAKYFLTIVDDFTRNTWTQMLHDKSQTISTVKDFYATIETQFTAKILTVRSDNGIEFIQHSCHDFFLFKGILHQRSIVKTPQQNGVAERKHRHLLDTARALRFHANLPKIFWSECILAATHIINMLPMSILNWQSPFELLHGIAPEYTTLRTISCLCFATNVGEHDKFET